MTVCCCASRYTAMETDDKRFLHGSTDYTGGEVNTTLFLVPVNHAVTSYIPGVSGVGRRDLTPWPTLSFQSQGKTGVSG